MRKKRSHTIKVLSVFLLLSALMSCKVTPPKEVSPEIPESEIVFDSDLSVNVTTTPRDSLVVVVNNNTDKIVELQFTLKFFTAEKKANYDSADSLVGVPPKAKVALEFEQPPNTAYYQLQVSAAEDKVISHYREVELSSKEDKAAEEITITAKNKAKEELAWVSVGVVFYQENKVIGYGYDMIDQVPAGKTRELCVYYPFDADYNTLKFDRYEILLLEAFTFAPSAGQEEADDEG